MKARELAEKLLQHPNADIFVHLGNAFYSDHDVFVINTKFDANDRETIHITHEDLTKGEDRWTIL